MYFLYFTDPMCSWCYGFGPELQKLVAAYRGKIGLEVVPGGLRAGETSPLSPSRAEGIARHWQAVRNATALPFKSDFFQKHPGFVYDTYPACHAVNAAERCQAGSALAYLETLQTLFYAEGNDPTNLATFLLAAEKTGLPLEKFQACFHEAQTEKQTRAGFERFQDFGGMGFPLLLLHIGGKDRVVAIGYQPFKHLQCVVENLLAREIAAPSFRAN